MKINYTSLVFPIFLILFSGISSGQLTSPQLHWTNESIISLLNYTFDAINPSIVIDSKDNIHIIWTQKTSFMTSEFFYTKLDREGNYLIDNLQLSNFGGSLYSRPSIGIDRWDNLNIVVDNYNYSSMEHRTLYTRLDDNGTIVVNGVILSDNFADGNPSISLDDSGNLLVVWGDQQITYANFDRIGNSLGPYYSFASSVGFQVSEFASSLDGDNNIHILSIEKNSSGFSSLMNFVMNKNGRIIYNQNVDQGQKDIHNPSIFIEDNGDSSISWSDSNESINLTYLSKIDKNGSIKIYKKLLPIGFVEGVVGVDKLRNINFVDKNQRFVQMNSSGDLIIGPIFIGSILNQNSSVPKMAINSQGRIHIIWFDLSSNNLFQIKYRRSLNPATLRIVGIARPGSQIQFIVNDIYNVNGNYTFGFSGGTYPELNLSDGRRVPLKDDPFLRASLYSPMAIGLINSVGRLNQNSSAVITFNIPNVPLNGTRLYAGFVTHDSTGKIVSISDPVSFVIN